MSEPLSFVIFGASGDLTARKLMPSLYRLFRQGHLSRDSRVVGVARSPLSDEQFRTKMEAAVREAVKEDWLSQDWKSFASRLFYVSTDAATAEGIRQLQTWLQEQEAAAGSRRVYYLAVAPNLYPEIAKGLGEAGMSGEEDGWKRIVIEKPFGRDLASARALNRLVLTHFREDQVYRIDHYLGKETVQNILVFRFGNAVFEPIWNRNFIDHVQITVAESLTVGQRGGYYDRAGVLRDMFQNHLLQLVGAVTMEAPSRFAAEPVRNERIQLLDSVAVVSPEEAAQQIICGQYEGYRSEPDVAPTSRTPTFAALRLRVDNWRWQGVPFYLRSGKGLASRASEVIIQFHRPPHLMFAKSSAASFQGNQLALCIQPDEGIHLSFQTKVPGPDMVLRPADLEFHYREAYAGVVLPDAYEHLLEDVLSGDSALFMRGDEIERAWQIIEPFLAATEQLAGPMPESYTVGSEGPHGAITFIAREGRSWLSLCHH